MKRIPPPPPRNIRSLITLLFLSLSFALPKVAQSQSLYVFSPSEIYEGGLVAQGVNESPSIGEGKYCTWDDSRNLGNVEREVWAELRNRTWVTLAYEFCVLGGTGQLEMVKGSAAGDCVSGNVSTGQRKPSERIRIRPVSDHDEEPDRRFTLSFKIGSVTSTRTVLLRDDDGSGYIGQRRRHPYGGGWGNKRCE